MRKIIKKTWCFVNSPFFVTFLAGALIAILTTCYQTKASRLQRERDMRLRQWEQKRDAFIEYCSKFPLAAQYSIDFKYRELWLLEYLNDKNRDDLIFPFDSRNYRETSEAHEKFRIKYAEVSSDYLFAIAYSFFPSKAIRNMAEDINETMDMLINSETADDTSNAYSEVREKYREIIHIMSDEMEDFYYVNDAR